MDMDRIPRQAFVALPPPDLGEAVVEEAVAEVELRMEDRVEVLEEVGEGLLKPRHMDPIQTLSFLVPVEAQDIMRALSVELGVDVFVL